MGRPSHNAISSRLFDRSENSRLSPGQELAAFRSAFLATFYRAGVVFSMPPAPPRLEVLIRVTQDRIIPTNLEAHGWPMALLPIARGMRARQKQYDGSIDQVQFQSISDNGTVTLRVYVFCQDIGWQIVFLSATGGSVKYKSCAESAKGAVGCDKSRVTF